VHTGGVGPIVGIGDVDGDGFADFAVRDQGNPTGSTVIVHFGNERRDFLVGTTLTQSDPGFGASIAAVGDVNGDGFPDIVVGADSHYRGSSGGAYLYLGGPAALFGVAADSIIGTAGQFAWWEVAPAGDVNGDGVDDIVIGGLFDPSNLFQGLVHVYQGQAINVLQTPYGTLTDRAIPQNGDYGVVVAR
jgi:hypothetical protein